VRTATRALWSASRPTAGDPDPCDDDPATLADLQRVVDELAARGTGARLVLRSPAGEPRVTVSAGEKGGAWIWLSLRVIEQGQPHCQSGAVGAPILIGDVPTGAILLSCAPGASGLRGHHLANARAAAAHCETILARRAAQRLDMYAAADGMLRMLAAHDPATARHAKTVRLIARSLGHAACLGPRDLLHLELAALLHDVGKIVVPPDILRKNGPLEPEEWAIIRAHPAVGERIVRGVPHLAPCLPAIRHHHERWDGHGYPDRLAGPAIPVPARLVGLADAYEALRAGRPYQNPRSAEDALRELEASLGAQFDPGQARLLRALGDAADPRGDYARRTLGTA